ncbi:MAG: electron transport complex subunit RsxE [Pseudomonadales bacterium]
MTDHQVSEHPAFSQGLWSNNPALIQLLGLCPLLAVSHYAVTAITLGVISLTVMIAANGLISLMRPLMSELIRLPLQIMVIASLVSIADLLLQAFYFELHERIGLFVALIVTNCAILGRAELMARRAPIRGALLDGLSMGLGFFWVMCVMGMLREVLGRGTLFAEAGRLTGFPLSDRGIQLLETPLQIMVFAPGAFFTLAFLIAGKNYLDQRNESRQTDRISQQTSS